MCVAGTCAGQQRASDTLELQLQTGVSHSVGVGDQTMPSAGADMVLRAEPSLQSLLPVETSSSYLFSIYYIYMAI